MSVESISFEIMQILLVVVSVAWWVFCIWYWIVSRWWENKYSRNLMAVGSSVAALYTLLIIYSVVDRWHTWMSVAANVILLASLYAVVRRTDYMDRVQRRDLDRN